MLGLRLSRLTCEGWGRRVRFDRDSGGDDRGSRRRRPAACELRLQYVRGQTWLYPPRSGMGLFVRELLGHERGVHKNEGAQRGGFRASCMRPHVCVCDLAALRPNELERFEAGEEFFKRLRYTPKELMNLNVSWSRPHLFPDAGCLIVSFRSIVDILVRETREGDVSLVPRSSREQYGREAHGKAGHR